MRVEGGGLGAEEVWQCTGVGGQRIWNPQRREEQQQPREKWLKLGPSRDPYWAVFRQDKMRVVSKQHLGFGPSFLELKCIHGALQQHSYRCRFPPPPPSFFILGDNFACMRLFTQGCCYKVVHKVVTRFARLLQGCLHGCYKVVYKVVTRLFTGLLQGCIQGCLQGCCKVFTMYLYHGSCMLTNQIAQLEVSNFHKHLPRGGYPSFMFYSFACWFLQD